MDSSIWSLMSVLFWCSLQFFMFQWKLLFITFSTPMPHPLIYPSAPYSITANNVYLYEKNQRKIKGKNKRKSRNFTTIFIFLLMWLTEHFIFSPTTYYILAWWHSDCCLDLLAGWRMTFIFSAWQVSTSNCHPDVLPSIQ